MCDLGRFDTRCNRLLYFLAPKGLIEGCQDNPRPDYGQGLYYVRN